jgi:hypothetical protein
MKLPLAVLLLACPFVAHASINRCADTTGTLIYSDQPCKAHHAVEAGPPIKTADDDKPSAATTSAETAPARTLVDRRSLRATALDAGRLANVGVGCPAYSKAALAEATRRAFMARDANQLSGLTDWRGSSRREADRLLSRYAYLVKHPVASVGVDTVQTATLEQTAQLQIDPYTGQPVYSDVATPPVDAIRVEFANTLGGEPSLNQYFKYASSGRCYWLKP